MNNATAVVLPPVAFDPHRLGRDLAAWLTLHWAEIALALAAGAVIVAVMLGLRILGQRLCRDDPGFTRWGSIIGKALASTRAGSWSRWPRSSSPATPTRRPISWRRSALPSPSPRRCRPRCSCAR